MKRLLVADRGETAVRVTRAAGDPGIGTAAVLRGAGAGAARVARAGWRTFEGEEEG